MRCRMKNTPQCGVWWVSPGGVAADLPRQVDHPLKKPDLCPHKWRGVKWYAALRHARAWHKTAVFQIMGSCGFLLWVEWTAPAWALFGFWEL